MVGEILQGQLVGGKVRLGLEAVPELYEQTYFGRRVSGGLELSLVEAVYLLDRSRISVQSSQEILDFKGLFQAATTLDRGFEFRYVVYKDLRERGYYVQPGLPDFRVYPRGGHPGHTPAEYYVMVLSERTPLDLNSLLQPLLMAGHMHRKLMLAVVDEESDITYYEAKVKDPKGKMEPPAEGGLATLLEDRVVLWDAEVSERLHTQGFFGKPLGGRLQLSLVESAYLLERGILAVQDLSGQPLDLEGFKSRARLVETDFDMKYRIYRDLRDRRLVVKTGFKFGTHFRAYKAVESLSQVPHSEYLVHAIPKDHVFVLPALSRAIRLAHSVRKEMVFAIAEKDVNYLEIRRLRP